MAWTPRRRTGAALGLLLVAVGLACSPEPSEVSEAEARLCNAQDQLSQAWSDFTSEGQNRAAARDELFDALAEMGHAASDLGQAENEQGNNPFLDLSRELRDTPDDADLAEIGESIAVAGGNFLQGVKDFVTGRDC